MLVNVDKPEVVLRSTTNYEDSMLIISFDKIILDNFAKKKYDIINF